MWKVDIYRMWYFCIVFQIYVIIRYVHSCAHNNFSNGFSMPFVCLQSFIKRLNATIQFHSSYHKMTVCFYFWISKSKILLHFVVSTSEQFVIKNFVFETRDFRWKIFRQRIICTICFSVWQMLCFICSSIIIWRNKIKWYSFSSAHSSVYLFFVFVVCLQPVQC